VRQARQARPVRPVRAVRPVRPVRLDFRDHVPPAITVIQGVSIHAIVRDQRISLITDDRGARFGRGY
jgi:hypothetical protein